MNQEVGIEGGRVTAATNDGSRPQRIVPVTGGAPRLVAVRGVGHQALVRQGAIPLGDSILQGKCLGSARSRSKHAARRLEEPRNVGRATPFRVGGARQPGLGCT